MPNGTTRRRTLALISLTAALAATCTVVGPAGAGERPGGGGHERRCSLSDAEFTTRAEPATGYDEAVAEYGNSGEGWTGGDSTYSIPLRDGRTAWIFSDTFLGPVNDDGSRPLDAPFLNNSVVVQDRRGDLTTFHGGTPEEPAAIIPPDEPNHWYWLGDGVETRRGEIQVVALKFWYGGGGAFDFGWDSTYLATLDPETFDLVSLEPLPSSAGIQWASWIEPAVRYTYVYGVEDLGASKYMHLARVRGSGLSGTWEYWTGSGWSRQESASARIMDGVANEYSVARFRDGYLMVTQDTHEAFSARIVGYVACSPTGPFREIGTLYTMPEVGPLGSYGNPNIFGYNAHEHPELRHADRTILTYNVNSFVSAELYEDVTIYRPRFVELEIDVDR
ncbi:conserved hypothetical protein [Beutenbergia cavernae DSM 12333]|uniref:DUF4185 domain-containing protein n=1 Tax=Beutenbergia cavernae (strain ATCC BAA-8 / DSM 12333 / CCUG 43141 / JCM 11478 / NBRC 16432 / NCIMB 13614 / HKI 0122) TaxID=471853 RepID=C5BY49_BEUC1|nr:DUF4185 domain-containing protein [Beutenbergia cavernae]ACQ80949.1 conserved hypothetical protein [Beutenbergia cavernae DSM 12333]